jgi:hypothetical protein
LQMHWVERIKREIPTCLIFSNQLLRVFIEIVNGELE